MQSSIAELLPPRPTNAAPGVTRHLDASQLADDVSLSVVKSIADLQCEA